MTRKPPRAGGKGLGVRSLACGASTTRVCFGPDTTRTGRERFLQAGSCPDKFFFYDLRYHISPRRKALCHAGRDGLHIP